MLLENTGARCHAPASILFLHQHCPDAQAVWTVAVSIVAVPRIWGMGAVPARDNFTVFEACIRIGIGNVPVTTGAVERTVALFHLFSPIS